MPNKIGSEGRSRGRVDLRATAGVAGREEKRTRQRCSPPSPVVSWKTAIPWRSCVSCKRRSRNSTKSVARRGVIEGPVKSTEPRVLAGSEP
jgi:hypothetical protein